MSGIAIYMTHIDKLDEAGDEEKHFEPRAIRATGTADAAEQLRQYVAKLGPGYYRVSLTIEVWRDWLLNTEGYSKCGVGAGTMVLRTEYSHCPSHARQMLSCVQSCKF